MTNRGQVEGQIDGNPENARNRQSAEIDASTEYRELEDKQWGIVLNVKFGESEKSWRRDKGRK